MPFNFFGQDPEYFDFSQWGAPAEPSPSGLSLADLWHPRQDTVYPEPPSPIASYAALAAADPEAKKALRREAILRAAAAFGGPSGQWGQGLVRAAQGVDEWKKGQVEEANQRKGQEYAASYRRTEQEAKRKEQDAEDEVAKRRAIGALEAIQAITEKEPAWAARAEAAAREGRHQDLDAMLKALPEREALRKQGIDPDDPYADDRVKESIKDTSEREQEKYWKDHGYKGYFKESPEEAATRAGAVAEAQAKAWAKYKRDGGTGPAGYPIRMIDGRPYEVIPDGKGGTTLSEIPGAPDRGDGDWQIVPGRPLDGIPSYRVNRRTGAVELVDEPFDYDLKTGKAEIKGSVKAADMERKKAKLRQEMGLVVDPKTGQAVAPNRPTIASPSKAPTNGPNPNPKSPSQAMPPARRGTVAERTKAELRQKIGARADLSPDEKKRLYARALADLEAGGDGMRPNSPPAGKPAGGGAGRLPPYPMDPGKETAAQLNARMKAVHDWHARAHRSGFDVDPERKVMPDGQPEPAIAYRKRLDAQVASGLWDSAATAGVRAEGVTGKAGADQQFAAATRLDRDPAFQYEKSVAAAAGKGMKVPGCGLDPLVIGAAWEVRTKGREGARKALSRHTGLASSSRSKPEDVARRREDLEQILDWAVEMDRNYRAWQGRR